MKKEDIKILEKVIRKAEKGEMDQKACWLFG